mgnify:CR=1 FL=1
MHRTCFGGDPVPDQPPQRAVERRSKRHRVRERRRARRDDEELLEGELVARVLAAVDDVEAGHGERHGRHLRFATVSPRKKEKRGRTVLPARSA